MGSRAGSSGGSRVSGPKATAAHFAAVWGSEQIVLPVLDISSPVFKYGAKATATDLFHHVVYAAAIGLAYSFLEHSESR